MTSSIDVSQRESIYESNSSGLLLRNKDPIPEEIGKMIKRI